MAISPKNRARALELAKELNELNGGRYHDDGTPKTFDELEIETNALTDLLSSMALNESAKDLPEAEKPVRCPKCKAVPKPHDPDDDASLLRQSSQSNELPCVPPAWLSADEFDHGIDGQTGQPQSQRKRKFLVDRRRRSRSGSASGLH